MFMHFIIHSIKADRVFDSLLDDCVELYQTWHVSHLVPGTDAGADSHGARLGFSTRGAPDDGVHFRSSEIRVVVDPQITIAQPECAFDKGARSMYSVDYYHWESDRSTETVRAAFSNATLARLMTAWRAAQGDERAARAALDSWLKADAERALLASLSAAGLAAAPWVPVGMSMLPILKLLTGLAAQDGDDFIGTDRFVVEIEGTGVEADTRWRVIPPDGRHGDWVKGQGKQSFTVRVEDARGLNIFEVRYVFRMID